MNTNIENTNLQKTEIAEHLNSLIAYEYALFTKTKNAYWNMHESDDSDLQSFFEHQYLALDKMISDIVEQVEFIGYFAFASIKDSSRVGSINNEHIDFSNKLQIIQMLVAGHEAVILYIENTIKPISIKMNEMVINSFAISISEKHEMMICMLKTF